MKLILSAVLLSTLASNAVEAKDSCAPQIPKSLRASLGHTFPAFRPPAESDNLPEDIEYNKKNGGTGCLGVAAADLNGDKKKDYVLALTPLKGKAPKVVIALRTAKDWSFHELMAGVTDARFRQYVDTVEPGKYERTEALEGGDGPNGDMESMVCPNSGALIGATESTGVVHCYINGKWLFAWVSD